MSKCTIHFKTPFQLHVTTALLNSMEQTLFSEAQQAGSIFIFLKLM